ncbi:MAG: CvpA family protein [Saprospiraceae bacterium]|nr:CvpA family protein [Saprospiraceae bacterium]
MYIDLFLGFFIVIGLIQGFHRGIVRTLFAVVSIIVGLLAALKFSPLVVNVFEHSFGLNPTLSLVLGFLLTFFVIMWGIRWLGRGFEKTLKLVKLNFLNRLLGAALFVALMIVTYSAIIWFLGRTEFVSPEQKASSLSYPYLSQIPEYTSAAIESLRPVFKGFVDKMDAVINATDTIPATE